MLATNREIESAAIEFVIAQEALEGRVAMDTRGRGMAADLVSADRVIEVKAFGGSSRGSSLWLEPRQVEEGRARPHDFWLYIVENVRQGDPGMFRLIQVGGEDLAALMGQAVERRYFTLPWPVAMYDRLTGG